MGNRRTVATTPATEYDVIRVLAQNVDGTQVARVPQRYTVRDIQNVVNNHTVDGVLDTVNVLCGTCGESVADCIELAPLLLDVPFAWSWQSKVDQD